VIILTGFGPYGKYTTNLSSEIVENLQEDKFPFQFVRKIIPVSWKQSIKTYKKILSNLKSPPKMIILLGMHTNTRIHLERFGWNFKFGDDIENKIKFGPIKINAPLWIKTILNLNVLYSHLKDKKLISISFFPGFYLCNYLYYWALYLSSKDYPVIFIHIPDKGRINEITEKIEKILDTIFKTHFKKAL